jgi:hypothetical protein
MEAHCVLCEVRTESLCIILIYFDVQGQAVQDLLDRLTQPRSARCWNSWILSNTAVRNSHLVAPDTFRVLANYKSAEIQTVNLRGNGRYFMSTASDCKGLLCVTGNRGCAFVCCRISVYLHRRTRHSVVLPYETECLFVVLFDCQISENVNRENIRAGKNVMTSHKDWGIWRSQESLGNSRHPSDTPWPNLNKRTPPSVSSYRVTFWTAS